MRIKVGPEDIEWRNKEKAIISQRQEAKRFGGSTNKASWTKAVSLYNRIVTGKFDWVQLMKGLKCKFLIFKAVEKPSKI